MGYLQIMSRIGSALAPWISDWLIQIHQVLPFAIMGMLTIIGAVLALWLPETKDQPTQETKETKESIKDSGSNVERVELKTACDVNCDA